MYVVGLLCGETAKYERAARWSRARLMPAWHRGHTPAIPETSHTVMLMGVERHAAAHHQPAPPSAPHQEVNTFALFHPAAAMQQQLLSTPPHPSPPSPPPPPHPPPPPDLQAIQFKLWDARASFTSLVPRVLLSALQWRLLRGVLVGSTRHARGTVRSQETTECERTSPPRRGAGRACLFGHYFY